MINNFRDKRVTGDGKGAIKLEEMDVPQRLDDHELRITSLEQNQGLLT